MPAECIHAAELTRNGRTTYYFTDCVDVLPPDIRNYRTLNMGTLADVQEAIARVEKDGYRVCWQVGDEYYETLDD